MRCQEALSFFANKPVIARHMRTLVDVGFGYVRLGQLSTPDILDEPMPASTSRTSVSCSPSSAGWRTRETRC